MRKRIFAYYLILIVIGVTITGAFTSQLTQKYYKQEVEERLQNTARLLQYQLSADITRGEKIDYNETAHNYARALNEQTDSNGSTELTVLRITFIDFKGKVLGESDPNLDYEKMENHGSRKETQEALRGKTGRDIRHSKTLDVDFLYIAVPLKAADVVIRVSMPLVQLKNIDRTILLYTIVGILTGLALTSLLALRFSSSLLQPIKALATVLKEISRGDYSKRVTVESNDELGELSETFNEMAIKLEKTVADLMDKNVRVDTIINSMVSGIVAVDTKHRIMLINSIACDMFGISNDPGVIGVNILEIIRNNRINSFLNETIENNVSLTNEITAGAPLERVLRVYTTPIKSNFKETLNAGGIVTIQDITNIKKLEQIRTEFVSNVTHELKTPLTSIRGFIETLRSGAIDDRDVAGKFLEIIDIEAERLDMLINDILQLSEIETRQKDSNIGTYSLKAITDEVLSVLEGVAERKGISLDMDVDGRIMIIANRDRIKQMLINLIDNGIKYNRENGSVTVKAVKAEGKIVISVKDTGIGIAEEHIPRIFERFYRVDKGRSRRMGGTGLGLSIVKHIVNLYNGDIRVNSIPGSGTEFIIQLPV